MNYLMLGEDTPETQELDFNNYSSLKNEDRPERDDLDWIIYAAKVPRYGEYAQRLQDSLSQYKEQAKNIQILFNQHLSKFGAIHLPATGLVIWIALKKPQSMMSSIPALRKLGVFKQENNPFLKPTDAVEGIRIGFACPQTEIWNEVFAIMAEHFKAALN
ncbi:hypothetical protein DBR11_06115 [Pedobacter sp. HMWF019]|uniref:hypothetical protein n=1 Tax=Pedobacter sp. HMWF019 TaxID=2056856 RepID=UPI000D3D2C21|nr:hypothetical protein [Pedobacter sp. HMWF019]PTT01964.1 hypothetical protein DBR11_06115 [Pedobacter sp. HMWF019]